MKSKINDRLITSHSHIKCTKVTITCEYSRIVRNDKKIDENNVIDSIFIALQDSSNCDDIKNHEVKTDDAEQQFQKIQNTYMIWIKKILFSKIPQLVNTKKLQI